MLMLITTLPCINISAYVIELGNDVVTMIGWNDKTDLGEPDQPTAATQNPEKSWAHAECG